MVDREIGEGNVKRSVNPAVPKLSFSPRVRPPLRCDVHETEMPSPRRSYARSILTVAQSHPVAASLECDACSATGTTRLLTIVPASKRRQWHSTRIRNV